MNYFTLYDLEYTTWDGAMQRRWMGENEYKEIIQIGAIKVNVADLSVIDVMNVLIKPKHNPVLSEYCMDLTGITQEQMDHKGVAFQQALDDFMTFITGGFAYAYGKDALIIAENVALHRADPQGVYGCDTCFIDVSYFMNRFAPETRQIKSGRLWEVLGQPKPHEAQQHDAVFDCYSILAALRALTERGMVLPKAS